MVGFSVGYDDILWVDRSTVYTHAYVATYCFSNMFYHRGRRKFISMNKKYRNVRLIFAEVTCGLGFVFLGLGFYCDIYLFNGSRTVRRRSWSLNWLRHIANYSCAMSIMILRYELPICGQFAFYYFLFLQL